VKPLTMSSRPWFSICIGIGRVGRAYALDTLGSAKVHELDLMRRHAFKLEAGHVVEQKIGGNGPYRGMRLLGAPKGWEPLPGVPARGEAATRLRRRC